MVWHLMLCLGGRREGIVGRLGILAAVALGRVRTALGCVEVGVALGAVDVAKRARLADVRRQLSSEPLEHNLLGIACTRTG